MSTILIFQEPMLSLGGSSLFTQNSFNSSDLSAPNTAGNSIFTNKIYIDNNWSETVLNYDWCSGLGTLNDPYIIENVIFKNLNFGNCIEIENSKEYFTIKNCTIKFTGLKWSDAGIRLYNVSNGKIVENIINSNLGYGIKLNQSTNISIQMNLINNNSYMGIGLENCNNSMIYSNDCNSNGFSQNSGFGISLIYSNNNDINMNKASKNKVAGYLLLNSSFNNISQNIGNNNQFGIYLANSSNNNQIISNTFIGNNYCYQEDDTCKDNIFSNIDCGPGDIGVIVLIILFSAIAITTISVFIIVLKRYRRSKKTKK
ncbi:MAG: right-handed parallel beta-helix repeat-containing protein [Candidatus Lokiarchaeota archaeon]